MEEKVLHLIFYLSAFILNGYGYLIFLLLILFLFKTNANKFPKQQFLEIANYTIIAYALLSIMCILLNIRGTMNENHYEKYLFLNRAFGPYWWIFWFMVVCNILLPQFFWINRLRKNIWFSFVSMIMIFGGEWSERVIIIYTSTHRDYITSSWKMYNPTWYEFFYNLRFTLLYFALIYLIYYISLRKNNRNEELLEN